MDDVIGTDTLIRDPEFPVHFTVGTGGIDLDGWLPGERPLWSAHRELAHGFLKVTATHRMLSASFVRATDGKVLDTMHIQDTAHAKRLEEAARGFGAAVWLLPIVVLVLWIVVRRRW